MKTYIAEGSVVDRCWTDSIRDMRHGGGFMAARLPRDSYFQQFPGDSSQTSVVAEMCRISEGVVLSDSFLEKGWID